jgi:collagen type III alpha
MASALTPEMSPRGAGESGFSERKDATGKNYVAFDEFVDFHVHKTQSHIKTTDIATTIVAVLVAFLSYVLLFVVFDQWVVTGGFGPWMRGSMLAVLSVALATVIGWRVVWPLFRRVNALYAARLIEKSDPSLKNALVSLVDLRESGTPIAEGDAAVRALEKRAAIGLSKVDVEHAVDRGRLLRLSYGLLAVVLVACAYIVLSPKDPFPSVRRALLPTSTATVATRTKISDVTPGDTELPARSLLTVEADIRGTIPESVRLVFTTADRAFVDQPVEMRRIEENLPRFRGMVAGANGKGLLQDIDYHIEAGDARTPSYHAKVVQPPSSTVDELKYVHPAYMQLENKVTAGGPIDGWEGSTLSLKATANMPIKSARLLFFDAEDGFSRGDRGEEVDLRVANGTEISGTWTLALRTDGTYPRFYRVMVETADKQRDPEPPQYAVKVRPDQPPEVAMLHPTSDMERPANAVVPFVVQATDPDFGLRTFLLKLEKNGESLVDQRLFEDKVFGQSFRGEHEIDLKSLGLKTGDTLAFWIEVRDTKQPVANRRATNKLNIKIVEPVSPEKVKEQLAADKQEQQDQLAQADPDKNDDPRDEPADPQPNNGKEPAPEPNPRDANPQPKEPDRAPAPNAAPKPGDREPDAAEPPANEAEKNGTPENKEGDKPQPPADDAEALEKFIRKLREEQAKGRPAEPNQGEAPQDQPGQPQDQPQEGDANPDNPGSPRPAEQKPGERSREGKKPADKRPNGANPSDKPESGKPEDKGMPDKPSQGEPGQDEGAEGAPKNGAPKQPERPGHKSPPSKSPNKNGDKPKSPEKGTNPANDQPSDPNPEAPAPGPKPGEKKPGSAKEPKPNDGQEPGEKPTAPRSPRDKTASPKPGDPEEKPSEEPRDGAKPANSDEKKTENGKPGGDKPGVEKPTTDKQPGSKEPMPADPSDKPSSPDAATKPGDKGMPSDPKAPQDKASPKDPGKPGDKPNSKDEPPKGDNPKGSDASRPKPGDMPQPGEKPEPGDAPNKPEDKNADGDMPQPGAKPEAGDGVGKKPENSPKDSGKPGDKGSEKGRSGDESKPGDKPKPGDMPGEGGDDAPMPSDQPGDNPSGKKGGDKPATRPGENGGKPKPAEAGPDAKRNPQGPSDAPRPDDNPASEPMPGEGCPEVPDAQPAKSNKPGQKNTDKPQDKGPMNSDSGPSTPGSDKDGGGPEGQKSPSKDGGEPGQKSTDGQGAESKPGDGKPGQGTPGKGKPGRGKPGEGKPGEGKPGEGQPGAGKSDEGASPDKGAGDKSAPKPPGDSPEKPAAPGGDKKPGEGNKPGAEEGDAPGDNPGDMPGGGGDKGGSDMPGDKPDDKPGDDAGGKPGDGKPGEGKPGDGKPGEANSGKSDKPGSGKSGSGKPGEGKPGEGGRGAGQPGGSGSGRGGGPNTNGAGKGAPGELGAPTDGAGDDPARPGQAAGAGKDGNDPDEGGRPAPESGLSADEQADKAKLEYARKASNLVLNRLKDELERGEVDQKTLDELGWTKQELEQFVKRLEQRVATPAEDDSPEAAAKRIQFEEELRSLRLGSESKSRTGSREVQRRTNVTNKKLPVPPELRDQYDAYTKGLSKSGAKPAKK